MKSSKRKISLAVALVISGFGVASAAMAQTAPTLVGGGSTLVQPTIGQESAVFPPAQGTISYAGVGSGAGQQAFLNNNPALVSAAASAAVIFANSDAPLTATDITNYQNGRALTDGPLIQIPYIVTPITIPLVNATAGQAGGSAATGPALPNSTTATVALDDADLCGIFSGAFTNWNQVTNPDNGSKYPAGAITVVYRSDNSGTSDLLTAHLAKVCPIPSGLSTNPVTFIETQNFGGLFATRPANFSSASGSGGVATLLDTLKAAGTAAVAYLSPDWTNTNLAPSSTSAAAHQLAVASVRNATTGEDVVPTFQNAALALGQFAAPTGTDKNVPATYIGNPANWVPNAATPATGYPISGTSQIILSQCYANHGNSPTVAASVVDFLTQHYSKDAAIMNGNGFATLPSTFQSLLVADFLTAGRTNTFNIGNASVCGAIAGR
jgi:phosphate transport system substrate-binding protein